VNAQDRAALAERMKQDARTDKAIAMARVIVATAREYRIPALEVFPTNDAEWFRVWRLAKCASAPSEQTKALCREFVEQQEQLEELERARSVATAGMVMS
jgi:hypothetical protein